MTLPPGVDAEKIRALIDKRRAGGELSAEEQQLLRSVMSVQGGAGARRGQRGDADTDYRFGGDFWVVVDEGDGKTSIANVRAGLTDLDKVEIVSGLGEGDRVLILPSAHLVETQEQLQSWINRRIGTVPGMGSR